ncbi:MAG: hypothetical protein M0P69_08715 [Bacteroidales bacterium]|nr:hypothetical protein [Bacteroidales bacterium]
MTKFTALEEKIINNMFGDIEYNYEEDKDDEDFNAGEFSQEMFRDQKTHFNLHPSAWAAKITEGMKFEEKNKLFLELFKTAWAKFVDSVQK